MALQEIDKLRRDLTATQGALLASEQVIRRLTCEKEGHLWKRYFKTRKCKLCGTVE